MTEETEETPEAWPANPEAKQFVEAARAAIASDRPTTAEMAFAGALAGQRHYLILEEYADFMKSRGLMASAQQYEKEARTIRHELGLFKEVKPTNDPADNYGGPLTKGK